MQSETLAETLAMIDAERDTKFALSFALIDRLIAEYGEHDLANRLYAVIPEECRWELVADLFGILIWSTSDNGSALMRTMDHWLEEGADLRKILIALHLDAYPFMNRSRMEEVLSKLAKRYPEVAQRCGELIASRRRLQE